MQFHIIKKVSHGGVCVFLCCVVNMYSVLFSDAPLRLAYKLLEDLSNLPQELAFITRYTEEEFGYFLEKYPHAITWKSIAIGLYKLEQNEHLEKLFKLLKSPEGNDFVTMTYITF